MSKRTKDPNTLNADYDNRPKHKAHFKLTRKHKTQLIILFL